MATRDINDSESVKMENKEEQPDVTMTTPVDFSITDSTSSGWSMVNSYGDIQDDDTVSTGSSVEIVDEDEGGPGVESSDIEGPLTPMGMSPSGRQLFVLRLSSHTSEHNPDDTDDEHAGLPDTSHPSSPINKHEEVTERLDSLTSTLDELRQQFENKSSTPVTTLGPSVTTEQPQCRTVGSSPGEDDVQLNKPVTEDRLEAIDREPVSMDISRNAGEADTDMPTVDMVTDTAEDANVPGPDVMSTQPSAFPHLNTIWSCVAVILVSSLMLNSFLLFKAPFLETNVPEPSNTAEMTSSICRVRLNEALQEIRDLKAEVGRLKYSVPDVGDFESVQVTKEHLEYELLQQQNEASSTKLKLEKKVNTTKARLIDVRQERDAAVKQSKVLREELETLQQDLTAERERSRQCCDTDSTKSTDSATHFTACWQCMEKIKINFAEYDYGNIKDFMPTEMFLFFSDLMKNTQSYYQSQFSDGPSTRSDWHESEDQFTTSESQDTNSEHTSDDEGMESDYWTSIMKMLNTTRHNLEETWTKVRSRSETLIKKHEPKLRSLQDTFMKKMEKLNVKIQQKMSKKWKKWFSDANGDDDDDDDDDTSDSGYHSDTEESVNNDRTGDRAGTFRRKHTHRYTDEMDDMHSHGKRRKAGAYKYEHKHKRHHSFRGEDDEFGHVSDEDLFDDDEDDGDDDSYPGFDDDYHDHRYFAENLKEGDAREDNWYIELGEDREYQREEPDDWYFKRHHKKDKVNGPIPKLKKKNGQYPC